MGIDEVGIDKVGIDEVGRYPICTGYSVYAFYILMSFMSAIMDAFLTS